MQRQASWAGWRVLLELHESAPLTVALMEISSLHASSGPEESLKINLSGFLPPLFQRAWVGTGALEGIGLLFSMALSESLSPLLRLLGFD